MFMKHWNVLVVDDEPDVLAVSRLAMRDIEVDGIPIKLHTATSGSGALELLNGTLSTGSGPSLAVAFIDVVMETDQAGLDLCRQIREQHRNSLSQLYIRTGQPGVAPERSVIDRFDINGYFTKAEATEDKLYSLVKAGVRQYATLLYAFINLGLVNVAIEHSASGEAMGLALAAFLAGRRVDAQGQARDAEVSVQAAFFIDESVACTGIDQADAIAERQRLAGLPGTATGAGSWVYDGRSLLVTSVASATAVEASVLFRDVGAPEGHDVRMFSAFLKAVGTLARRSAAGARTPVGAAR